MFVRLDLGRWLWVLARSSGSDTQVPGDGSVSQAYLNFLERLEEPVVAVAGCSANAGRGQSCLYLPSSRRLAAEESRCRAEADDSAVAEELAFLPLGLPDKNIVSKDYL